MRNRRGEDERRSKRKKKENKEEGKTMKIK